MILRFVSSDAFNSEDAHRKRRFVDLVQVRYAEPLSHGGDTIKQEANLHAR